MSTVYEHLEYRALMLAVREHPIVDNLMPLADYLGENGEEERAEFIHTQIQLERLNGLLRPLLMVGRADFEQLQPDEEFNRSDKFRLLPRPQKHKRVKVILDHCFENSVKPIILQNTHLEAGAEEAKTITMAFPDERFGELVVQPYAMGKEFVYDKDPVFWCECFVLRLGDDQQTLREERHTLLNRDSELRRLLSRKGRTQFPWKDGVPDVKGRFVFPHYEYGVITKLCCDSRFLGFNGTELLQREPIREVTLINLPTWVEMVLPDGHDGPRKYRTKGSTVRYDSLEELFQEVHQTGPHTKWKFPNVSPNTENRFTRMFYGASQADIERLTLNQGTVNDEPFLGRAERRLMYVNHTSERLPRSGWLWRPGTEHDDDAWHGTITFEDREDTTPTDFAVLWGGANGSQQTFYIVPQADFQSMFGHILEQEYADVYDEENGDLGGETSEE